MGLLLLAAIEAKEAALAVPLLIALFCPRQDRKSSARRVMLYRSAAIVLVLAAAAAFLYLLARAGEPTVGVGASARIHPAWYFLTETRVFYTYLRLLFIPKPQSLEYDFVWIHSLSDPLVWIRLVGIGALVASAFALYRNSQWRTIGFSILAFFVLLAPTSSWIPSSDAAFEHRLYLPMLAFSLLLAVLLARVRGRNVVLVALAIVLSILTVSRERIWASDVRLWEDTVQHVPLKARAWFNLGGAAMNEKPDEAQRAFARAIELQPKFPEAWYDLGIIEAKAGNIGKAYEDYQRAVRDGPDYWPAWNNLGNVVFAMGERDRAIDILETTLRLNPDYWPAQYNIAVAEYSGGRYNEAIPRLRTVLDWRPDFKEARYLLAMALKQTGNQTEAEREWMRVGNLAGHPPMPAMIPSMVH
jgi:tetratricopeptide (TPR) repeat protein